MGAAPVEWRRGRHRLLADDNGLTIARGRHVETWPWEHVVAVGADSPDPNLVQFAFRGLGWLVVGMRRRCFAACVAGVTRPAHAFAVRFPRRLGLRPPTEAQVAEDLARLREVLGPWLDRTSTRGLGEPDLGMWWYAQREARPLPAPKAPTEPSFVDRAAAVRRELVDLRAELDRIRRR